MTASAEARLIQARELFYSDTDGALRLYRDLVRTLPIGHEWAAAHIDLAMYEYGVANFETAVSLTREVIDAGDAIEKDGRAIAGILLCQTLEMLDREIDEIQLSHWVDDALATGHTLNAAVGTAILGDVALKHDEAKGRALLERSIELHNDAGSMNGGPSILQRLAKLDIKQGKTADARLKLERALERLKGFPLGGTSVRVLESRIKAQLDGLP